MGDIEHAISTGAGALVKGGIVCDPVTGDVLHDYDWTPYEAAEAVLKAVNYQGAVEALRTAHGLLAKGAEVNGPAAYAVLHGALDRLGGQ